MSIIAEVLDLRDLTLDNTISYDETSGTHKANNGEASSEFFQQGNRVVVERHGRKVTWTPSLMKYTDEYQMEDILFTVEDVPLEVNGNVAVFNRSYPDVDDEFIQENDRLKHNIILREPQREPVPWMGEIVDFVFGGRLEYDSDLQIRTALGFTVGVFRTPNFIEFVDPLTGNVVFTLPQIVAYDAAGAVTTGSYNVTQNENGILAFDIVMDNGWISAPEREYPITIDPTNIYTQSHTTGIWGGHKFITLDNGYKVVSFQSGNSLLWWRTKDGGNTWEQFAFSIWQPTDMSIAKGGGNWFGTIAIGSGSVAIYMIDGAQAVDNYNRNTNYNVGTGSLDTTACSIACNPNNTQQWAAVACRVSGDTNNTVHVFESSDGGASWGYVNPFSPQGSTLNFVKYPEVVWHNNAPMVFVEVYLNGNGYSLVAVTRAFSNRVGANGNTWTQFNGAPSWGVIEINGPHTAREKIGPNAIVKKRGSNQGRIWVAWHGRDTTTPNEDQIFAAYSDNGGLNWTVQKLTSSAGTNKRRVSTVELPSGAVAVVYEDASTLDFYYCLCNNGSATFGAPVLLLANTNNVSPRAEPYPPDNRIHYVHTYNGGMVLKYDTSPFLNSPPNAPGITSPAATDQFFNVRTPTVSWTYSDPDGNPQGQYLVTIWSDTLGAEVWNSGWVASAANSVAVPAGAINHDGYFWANVWVRDNQGAESPGSSRRFRIDSILPNGPTFTVTLKRSTSIQIDNIAAFSDASPSSGQKLRHVLVENANNTVRLQTNTPANNITSYVIAGLSPDTTYRIAVVDQDNAGNYSLHAGGAGNWVTVKTSALPVTVVQNLSSNGYLLSQRPSLRVLGTDADGSKLALNIQISKASNFATLLADAVTTVTTSTGFAGWQITGQINSGTVVTYIPQVDLGTGTVYVRVRSYDESAAEYGNFSATYSFTIQSPGWTDPNIRDGEVRYRKPWIDELRTKVNAVRQARGLAVKVWTDPVLTVDVTKARKVHMDELRTAIQEIHTALGKGIIAWTDPNVVVDTTKRDGRHIKQLRTQLEAA